jgi:hypothetical protein
VIGNEDRHFRTFPFGHGTWKTIPSEEILAKLAAALDVSPDELKQYDTRGPIADLKRLMDLDPKGDASLSRVHGFADIQNSRVGVQ